MNKLEMIEYLKELNDEDIINFNFLGTESNDYDDGQLILKVQSVSKKIISNAFGKTNIFPLTITLETDENK